MDSEQAFKFLDRFSSSRFGCDVCQRVPANASRAQCCGAVYCQTCAELVQSSAAIAGDQQDQGSFVAWNPAATTCTKCKGIGLTLFPDPGLQENIDQLQVECLKPGCGWIGVYSAIDFHLRQPHDTEEMIYDNEAPQEPEEYEEQVYDNEGQDGGEDIYDNDGTLQDSGEQIYDEAPAEDAEEEGQIYDNEAPEVNTEEIYDEAPADDPDVEGQIYDNDNNPEDIGELLYEDATPEVDRMSFTTETPPKQAQAASSSQPPTDYREVTAGEAIQQQQESVPGKPVQQLQPEQGSISSYKRENLCLRFYKSTHNEDFYDITAREKL